MGSSSGFLEEAPGWSFSIVSPCPLPSQLTACGQSQTHQLHHFLFSFAFIPILEAIPEMGAVYTLEMCRFLFVSFAFVPFSFCFSLLAFGEGCAEPDELNPNPLSSSKTTKMWLIPTCWPRRMDLRGMMEICPGWNSLLCCFLHTGANFPFQILLETGSFCLRNVSGALGEFLGYFL